MAVAAGGRVEYDPWYYRDASGCDAFVMVRVDTPGGKEMRPFRPAKSGWRMGFPESGHGRRPLLYLDEIKASSLVLVVEGEKCADALRRVGFDATTSAAGAQAADKTDWTPLAGKEVVIVPDNDEAGAEYARRVSEILRGLGPPAEVTTLLFDRMPVGADVADLMADYEGFDLQGGKGQPWMLCDAWEPDDVQEAIKGLIERARKRESWGRMPDLSHTLEPPQASPGPPVTVTEAVVVRLGQLFKDGPLPSKFVREQAAIWGVRPTTLHEALTRAGIVRRRVGTGWMMFPPLSPAPF
jgi:hypothetical protein